MYRLVACYDRTVVLAIPQRPGGANNDTDARDLGFEVDEAVMKGFENGHRLEGPFEPTINESWGSDLPRTAVSKSSQAGISKPL